MRLFFWPIISARTWPPTDTRVRICWRWRFTTACYGFLSLLLAFRIARKYFDDQWAFLATIGIWMASSLPIYMYFNPSWSHAFSAFTVALFLWYWDRTRLQRTAGQWAILGLAGRLDGKCLLSECHSVDFSRGWKSSIFCARSGEIPARPMSQFKNWLSHCGVFFVAFIAALFPTFITRQIIYGSPFETGYPAIWTWNWTSPALAQGLVFIRSRDVQLDSDPDSCGRGAAFSHQARRLLGAGSLLTFLAYYYFIASYPDWDGLSSFGNRFFVSLTPIFILGLAALLGSFSSWLGKDDRARCGRRPGPGVAHCCGTSDLSFNGARTWFRRAEKFPGARWFTINSSKFPSE